MNSADATNVPIAYHKLVRVLEMEGFTLARERDDHMIFTKPGSFAQWWFPVTTACQCLSSRTCCARRRSAEEGTWNYWNAPRAEYGIAQSYINVLLYRFVVRYSTDS